MANLTAKQARAIDALLAGQTRASAAAAAGVAERTLDRWRAEHPTFSDELNRRSTLALRDATLRLKSSIDEAVDVLREVMTSADSRPAVRLRAAQVVIESSLKLIEATDLMERLEALEAIIKNETVPPARR